MIIKMQRILSYEEISKKYVLEPEYTKYHHIQCFKPSKNHLLYYVIYEEKNSLFPGTRGCHIKDRNKAKSFLFSKNGGIMIYKSDICNLNLNKKLLNEKS